MAKLSKIEARKAMAMEAQVIGLMEVSRKLDWIILHIDPDADPAMIGAGLPLEMVAVEDEPTPDSPEAPSVAEEVPADAPPLETVQAPVSPPPEKGKEKPKK